MKRRFLFTSVAFFACALMSVQAGDRLTLEQVLSSPFPFELKAAPTGDRVAWVFRHQGRRNIWIAEGPDFQARQLTPYGEDDGQEISALTWSWDGETLVYVSGGPRSSAGDIPNPTSDPAGAEQAIWAISVSGGSPRRISEGNSPVVSPRGDRVVFQKGGEIWVAPLKGEGKPEKFFAIRGQSSSPAWSPDGSALAFVSSRGSHGYVVVYQVAAGQFRFVAPGVDRDREPRWSPDGQHLAFIRSGDPVMGLVEDRPLLWSIWVADRTGWKAREIWKSPDTPDGSYPRMAGTAVLQWAGNDRLVFVSEMNGWQQVYSIPISGGEPLLLTPGEGEVEYHALTPDGGSVVYASNHGDIDRRHLWKVPTKGGSPVALTSGPGIETVPAVTGTGDYVAFFSSDARQPLLPAFLGIGGGEPRLIAAHLLAKDFPSGQLVEPQGVVFQAADGWNIHGQLFLPPGRGDNERGPAVIFMHGGPVRQMFLGWHNRGYYHNAYAFNQYLASRGYLVLSVNYRSGIGYGRGFREAPNRGARGASEYQDIVAAGRYLQTRSEVDPKRIGLWGGSYGGYLTALGLARDSDLFAAGVDLHGVHDWSRRFSDFDRSGAGMNPERARVARESSPVAYVNKWRAPVLLVHGDDDRNVDFAQTVDLVRRLQQQGVHFELLVYPDEVHDFLLHRHWLEIYRASADFFDRYLGNAH